MKGVLRIFKMTILYRRLICNNYKNLGKRKIRKREFPNFLKLRNNSLQTLKIMKSYKNLNKLQIGKRLFKINFFFRFA
jgi:hypothetical protein